MNDYFVTWTINVDADSPEEAARVALTIQRDRLSDALCFTVRDTEREEETLIDLSVRG